MGGRWRVVVGMGGWVVDSGGEVWVVRWRVVVGRCGWVVEGSGGDGWVGGYWSSGAAVVEAGCLCT